jgi:hypothetical protein
MVFLGFSSQVLHEAMVTPALETPPVSWAASATGNSWQGGPRRSNFGGVCDRETYWDMVVFHKWGYPKIIHV